MNKTDNVTDLNWVRCQPSRFPWGQVMRIYSVKHYSIIEYIPSNNLSALHFHVYVEEKDTCQSTETFEGALLLAISIKQKQSDFFPAIAKLLDLK